MQKGCARISVVWCLDGVRRKSEVVFGFVCSYGGSYEGCGEMTTMKSVAARVFME